MAQRIFNVITIAGSCLIIAFLNSVFYLGTQESFQELKENLFQSFISRTSVGALLGLPTLIVLVIGNMIFNSRVDPNRRVQIGKLLLISVLATSLAAVLGTTFFFNR